MFTKYYYHADLQIKIVIKRAHVHIHKDISNVKCHFQNEQYLLH